MSAFPNQSSVRVLDHPLVAVRLSTLRSEATPPEEFRRSLQEIAALLLFEAARNWATDPIEIKTPLQACTGAVLKRPVALVPILRAGVGMAEGMLRVLPEASVGHIGLSRDPETLRPTTYYRRLPENIAESEVLLLDPMLATGHSASEGAAILKKSGARRIQFICLLGCPPGVEQFQRDHPDIPIIAAAIDPELSARGYIVPGLGDSGDRYFGT